MMIWEYSFKHKTSGGQWSQKKEDMKPWTSHSVSRLKFKILIYHHVPHFYSYWSLRKWWFENILSNTRHLDDPEVKRKKIWSLELHIACHIWNSKSLSIILFPISNHIDHWANDDLRIFFQMQDIWMTLRSKEGRYGALNFI